MTEQTSTQPWYPASWLDADGKPLPDVHEVTPGEWPPCRPKDHIEFLMGIHRKNRDWPGNTAQAHSLEWWFPAFDFSIVAIRIIERAA